MDRVRVAASVETGMSVHDLAEDIGISNSAVHRLKQMIEQEAAEAAAGSGRCRNGGLMALSRVPPPWGAEQGTTQRTVAPTDCHSGARALAREPGIHNHRPGLWIPGSPHAAKFTQAA